MIDSRSVATLQPRALAHQVAVARSLQPLPARAGTRPNSWGIAERLMAGKREKDWNQCET